MGRIYSCGFVASISAIGHAMAIEFQAPMNYVHEVRFGATMEDEPTATVELLRIGVGRLGAVGDGVDILGNVTQHDPGDSITQVTSLRGPSTTPAPIDFIISDSFSVFTGWLYVPPPELRLVGVAGDVFSVDLPEMPMDTLPYACTFTWEEEG